ILVVAGMVLHQVFGESTTYSRIAGNVFLLAYSYSVHVFKTVGWEPLSDIGTFSGAFFAAVFLSRRFTAFRPVVPPSWRQRFGSSHTKRIWGAFGGGFLMLFGARMADGCASGHILSGGIQMALSAFEFTLFVMIAALITARAVYGKDAA
ncbi:MAG: YeeE/YedE thiosulfate transporter family protein, partial [Firmicutes bacterium]|nr:YeeE/YedE thiosulfate transporter family protein [Bacillota bacterium]